jgi:amidase
LRDLGCACEEVDLGWTDEIDEAASVWFAFFGTSAMLLEALAREPSNVSPDLRRLGEHLRRTRQKPDLLAHVFRTITAMNAGFERAMRGFDIFICPTMAIPAVKADQSMWAKDFDIEGVNVDPEWGYSMTHPFNLLCTCPVISVPSGLSKEGLPTGIQVVGSPFDEHSVFRLALAYEAAIGPFPCVNATFLE